MPIDVHDALLTDLARPIYDRQIGSLGGADHRRLAPGDATAACDPAGPRPGRAAGPAVGPSR